jgi:hypothetical protein
MADTTTKSLVSVNKAQGSTSFWRCKVRCWRWLCGNNVPISLCEQSQARLIVNNQASAMCEAATEGDVVQVMHAHQFRQSEQSIYWRLTHTGV